MSFKGKTVLVTGACGNLGRTVANAFIANDANVIVVDRHLESLKEAYGPTSRQHLAVEADLANDDQVRSAVRNGLDLFGRIDVLCNIAGGFWMGPQLHETEQTDWDSMFDMNVRGLLNVVREVVPAMIDAGGGKIVNVAANSALRGAARMGAYCASKDVVVRLTETMSLELRDRSINVNCVLPSILDTQQNRQAMPDADFGRWVTTEALSDVMLFLASPAARAIHGAALAVTGRV